MVAQQQPPAVTNHLVEEKHFSIKLERSADLLKEALEDAIGADLTELAHGMWFAKTAPEGGVYREITVRALPTDQGTSVEVRIEHHSTPAAMAFFITAAIVGSLLLVPLFWLIAKSQLRGKEQSRDRLVQMHKIWTELTAAIGAPKKAGYRGRPERVRVRVDELAEDDELAEVEVPADDDATQKA